MIARDGRIRARGAAALVLGMMVLGAALVGAVDVDQGGGPTVGADDARLERSEGRLSIEGAAFTGVVETRAGSGAVTEQVPYLDGLRDGVARAWYEDGALRYERGYREGREVGVHRGWYQDGRLKFEERFVGGLLQGTAREWFPDGTAYRDFTYVAGHEEGLQRMWYPDGELRANYVVRDGRRFGRLGAKGCTGEDESSQEVTS